jgi:hypothetical protein
LFLKKNKIGGRRRGGAQMKKHFVAWRNGTTNP